VVKVSFMQKNWRDIQYATSLKTDVSEGWTAVELHKATERGTTLVARVVFWDAEGQFALELPLGELPLEIVEALIAEAKASISTR
jgi:hypothetical protein